MLEILPIATVVAIIVFITKETLEFFRRMGERRRKKRAIKSLIRDELRANHLALNLIDSAIHSASQLDYREGTTGSIVAGHGGRTHHRIIDKNGEILGGGMIRPVKTTEYQRLLPQAAELDFKLYEELREGHGRIQELEHIVNSFIENFGNAPDDQWWPGFCEWASACLCDISKDMVEQYVKLGGDRSDIRVPPGLIRRSAEKDAA
jgi:hypothetical protein